MIKVENTVVEAKSFPDGTQKINLDLWRALGLEYVNPNKIDEDCAKIIPTITWLYQSDLELVTLMYVVGHLKEHGFNKYKLYLPYVPNARQDRVKTADEVFTLKHFAGIINSMNFLEVTVFDPHSSVTEALIDRVKVKNPMKHIIATLDFIGDDDITLYFPDEGAMKRYYSLFEASRYKKPYVFGIKNRDWKTGEIKGLSVAGQTDNIIGKNVLIIDDICSKGGTFFFGAKKLKELGAKDIYLYVSHCEENIFYGEVFKSGLIKKVYTTNSIFNGDHQDTVRLMNLADKIHVTGV